jgi:hypothetical protein
MTAKVHRVRKRTPIYDEDERCIPFGCSIKFEDSSKDFSPNQQFRNIYCTINEDIMRRIKGHSVMAQKTVGDNVSFYYSVRFIAIIDFCSLVYENSVL